MIKKITGFVLVVGTITGCASPQWHNPNYSADQAAIMAKQRAIDEGYCTQVAHGSAPMPDVRVYSPTQDSYSVSGTISSYGSGGLQTSNYTGYVTPSAGNSFSTGFAQGAALGAAIRARRAQDKIMRGCMLQLGWSDEPVTQQSAPPNPQPSETKEGSVQVGSEVFQSKEARKISCDDWSNDIATVIRSGHSHGVDIETQRQLAAEYLRKINGSGRQLLIFMHLINMRYKVSLDELSSEDYLRYVKWECEQNWAGIGLNSL